MSSGLTTLLFHEQPGISLDRVTKLVRVPLNRRNNVERVSF